MKCNGFYLCLLGLFCIFNGVFNLFEDSLDIFTVILELVWFNDGFWNENCEAYLVYNLDGSGAS